MSRNINICNVKMLPIFFTENLSACPVYSGLADFGSEKTLPLYFVDEKHLVGI